MMLLRISSGKDQDFLSRGSVTEPMLRERLRDSERETIEGGTMDDSITAIRNSCDHGRINLISYDMF